jgi:hypothetical protein
MSAAIKVFLQQSKLPTVDALNAAIKAAGFDLVLDPADLHKDDGYLPAMWEGEESGFEWYLASVDELEDAPPAEAGDANTEASLLFTSEAGEEVAAAVTAALLATITGGAYWDPETDKRVLRGEAALAAARAIIQRWRDRAA